MGALLKRDELPGKIGTIRPFYEAPPVAASQPREPVAARGPEPPERHLRLLQRIAEEMVRERARLLTEIRPEVLELVFRVAREIIQREVAADPAVVEHTLEQALQNLHFATKVVVRLHPDDLAHLQEHQAAWREHTAQLEFVPDPEVERGGCRLDSDRGGFDATLQTQLSILHEALAASYNG